MIAAKSGEASGVQRLKEPSHRVVESQATLRSILPDNKFAENPNCLGLAGSTLSRQPEAAVKQHSAPGRPQGRVWDFVIQNLTMSLVSEPRRAA